MYGILQVKNLEKLLPNNDGADYALIYCDKSAYYYKGDKKDVTTGVFLYYPIRCAELPSTYSIHFEEKLGITDSDEATQLIQTWNRTFKNGFRSVKFAAVFRTFQMKFGVLVNPDNDHEVLIFGSYSPHTPQDGYTVGPGRGGYAWGILPKRVLKRRQDDVELLRKNLFLKSNEIPVFMVIWKDVIEQL
jgi:hypothetical protein